MFTQNMSVVILFGNRVFAEVIKLRCQTGLGRVLNPMTGMVIRRRRSGHCHRQREEGPVTTEVKNRVMGPQAREHQGLPAITRGWQRQGGLLLQCLWRTRPRCHLDFRFLASRTMKEHISAVFSQPLAVIFYSSPKKPKRGLKEREESGMVPLFGA